MPDGTRLFAQSWQPEQAAKAQVLLVHGLAEHAGRYAHVAEYFNARGIGLFGYDHRGHGQSDGLKAYVHRYNLLLDDLDQVLTAVREKTGPVPLFLYGHSMGGGVICLHAIERKTKVNGLILSAPAVKVSDDISPFLVKAAPVLGAIAPKLKTVALDGEAISSDPREVEKYNTDPLNYRGKTYARTGAELIDATKRIQKGMEALTQPVLILHGTADRLTDPEGSKQLLARAGSTDKSLKLFEGWFHEIHNEPEREQVFMEITDWIGARI